MKPNRLALLIVALLTAGMLARAVFWESGGSSPLGADSAVLELSQDSFVSTLSGTSQPVLVEFWATWCRPCRQMAPTIEAIARDMQGRAVVAKVDVDRARDVAAAQRVSSVPTLILYKDGQEIGRLEGLASEARVRGLLESALGAASSPSQGSKNP